MQPNQPMAPPPPNTTPGDDPIEPPIQEPIEEPLQDSTMVGEESDTLAQVPQQQVDHIKVRPVPTETIEAVARRRTSEPVVQFMAGLAIQIAIRSRHPEKQKTTMREAEQGRLQYLWNKYTRRALHLGY